MSGLDEPILSYINRAFAGTGIDWDVAVCHKEGEVFKAARKQKGKVDMVAVYGGDGSIMEAARALYGAGTPMAILAGGTANIMAKELNIPLDTPEALEMLAADNFSIQEIDMGLVNGCPFLLRLNLGILADMVTETTNEMKDSWGQWAYGITAFDNLQKEPAVFNINIDGQQFVQEAVALTVTNAGNVGKKGYSFLPGISVYDGWLDVIALDKADFVSLLKVTGSVLLKTDSSVLKHWKGKNIKIQMAHECNYVLDDSLQQAHELVISVAPKSLKIVVPKVNDK